MLRMASLARLWNPGVGTVDFCDQDPGLLILLSFRNVSGAGNKGRLEKEQEKE